MQLNVDWAALKAFATSRGLSLQFIALNNMYHIYAIDNLASLCCQIDIESPVNADQTDFETNFKPNGNKPIPQQQQPFASKVLPNGKKLFKREHGIQQTVAVGPNIIIFTVPYSWAKLTGMEILYAEKLDTCDFMVLDSTTGTYSTVPNMQLSQFGFSINIAEFKHEEVSSYDADLYLNMQIKLVYKSVTAKTIGINFTLNEVK